MTLASASRRTFEKVSKERILTCLLLAVVLVTAGASTFAQTAASPSSSGQTSTPASQASAKKVQEVDENDVYRHSAVVRAIGSKLGLSPEQAAKTFEVANFTILALLVLLFLAKSLPKIFRDRTGLIQKHLVDARMATEEAAARMNNVEDRLNRLDQQIADMRERAEKDWLAEEDRLKASVQEEKQKILIAADGEIASATAEARRQIQRFATDLAIDQAAKKLVVTAETDRLLVQNFARRLTGEDDRGGQN